LKIFAHRRGEYSSKSVYSRIAGECAASRIDIPSDPGPRATNFKDSRPPQQPEYGDYSASMCSQRHLYTHRRACAQETGSVAIGHVKATIAGYRSFSGRCNTRTAVAFRYAATSANLNPGPMRKARP